MNTTNIAVWITPGYIDQTTGNLVLTCHIAVRATDGSGREGDVSYMLPNWSQTAAQKRSSAQTAIVQYVQQSWGWTVPTNNNWDIYGV